MRINATNIAHYTNQTIQNNIASELTELKKRKKKENCKHE